MSDDLEFRVADDGTLDDDGRLVAERAAWLLTESVRLLDPDDRAERLAWIREFGAPGLSVFVEGDGLIRVFWAGKPLCGIEPGALDPDGEPVVVVLPQLDIDEEDTDGDR